MIWKKEDVPIQENILFSDDSKKTVHSQSYEAFFLRRMRAIDTL
ncbi:hypothetical protein M23134_03135 [Microscilla marina ATCC 23134]|uniref:Uncharacterized protein n=1 Tax=Microscilla marina ATCC 23134 TaxID=313606 RepID=A1ZG82_MICM2|nr:hypothetical protein M23134_00558 [Microscilla marina ATCC 23134]EAY30499.1 hypothetical protein M23134_03135 [Microscilla marina ATCC 23134]